ncbi:MAG: sigma-54 dependent transcriptional regulator [Lentisphaeria bacterium]
MDDELSIVEVLKALLKREGYGVQTAPDGATALGLLQAEKFDLMISDIRMRPMDGISLLLQARQLQGHLGVIMMTAYATVETAVEAMKNGAFDYICKPFKIDELLLTVQHALTYEQTLVENEALKETLRGTNLHYNMVGDSPKMLKVYEMIEKIARTESTVLILGESGTGKELVARALHHNSRRTDKPFVAINCAAIPETLLESELFGFVRGAFTGANKDKKGLFETAEGGTLLLDEVGSIPGSMQSKLLRVLQEREIMAIGATKAVPVDVRIVAATNERLEAKIKAGLFREDLFYRLSVIPIDLPPLRERTGDVPLLANYFLGLLNEREKKDVTIDKAAMRALQGYAWPGNVRELENVIMRAGALCENNQITLLDMPVPVQAAAADTPTAAQDETAANQFRGSSLKSFLRAKERDYIQMVLNQCGGNKEKAAELLGISLATFYRKLGDA